MHVSSIVVQLWHCYMYNCQACVYRRTSLLIHLHLLHEVISRTLRACCSCCVEYVKNSVDALVVPALRTDTYGFEMPLVVLIEVINPLQFTVIQAHVLRQAHFLQGWHICQVKHAFCVEINRYRDIE